MRDKCKLICLMCMIFILTLSGCGGVEGTVSEGTTKRPFVNWELGFRKGALSEGSQMYTIDYRELFHEHPEGNSNSRLNVIKNAGDDYVDFRRYYMDERTVYYLERFPMGGGEAECLTLHPRDWEFTGNEIWGFDVWGEKYYFGVGVYGDEEIRWDSLPAQIYLVTTDREGELQSKLDIAPGLLKLEATGGLQSLHVDSNGYIYAITMNEESGQSLYVLDDKGKAVAAYVCPVASKDAIFEPVRDDRGRIFFPIKDSTEGATRLMWKNDMDKLTELCRFEGEIIETWYTMLGNELYYVANDSVVKWDVVSGECETVYRLKENGISDPMATVLYWDNSDKAYLRYSSKSVDWVSRISEEEPELKDAVDIGILVRGDGADYVKASLAIFGRKHPQYPIEVITKAEDNERDRLLMEVMNGDGPDVLYVTYEDMLRLQKKKALMQIEDLISDAIRNELLPGVKDFGKIEESLYGMPIGVELVTMFANREVWDNIGWSLDDVLETAEKNTNIFSFFICDNANWGPNDTLHFMLEYDLGEHKSKFVDWERGISNFEKNNFMEVLETIKYYDEHPYEGESEKYDVYGNWRVRVRFKAAMAYPIEGLSAEHFFYLCDEMGDNCYAVGMPAEDRQGNYLITDGMLVINKNIDEEKKEALNAMFEYLYGAECQKGMHNTISVLKDMVDSRVWYHEGEGKYYWLDGSDVWTVLPQKEDGTTYVEEYKKLLNSAVPYKDSGPLFDIVREESMAFFEGEKDALTVTRMIDNRVQLYLDENK